MRYYWFNIPTLLLGLIGGAFLPVSHWMLTPTHEGTKIAGWTSHSLESPLPSTVAKKLLSRPTRQISPPPNVPIEDKSIADLDAVLKNQLAASGRSINVVELSRAEGAASLLKSVFDWQQRNPARHKDLIFYVSPVNSSLMEERLIAEKVRQFMKRNSQKFQGVQGKTAFLFHSQENHIAHSLNLILARARTLPAKEYLGLASQTIRGKIDQVFWIRTTISRWDMIPRTGLTLPDQVIPAERINAFLVDPNRQLVTAIYLFPANTFLASTKIAR